MLAAQCRAAYRLRPVIGKEPTCRCRDEDGFLTLRDRSRGMIISGGSNIYPSEIEEVLLCRPDLIEVSVVGRPHPDWGEEVIAFVVARHAAKVAPEELGRRCLDHIARFKPATLPVCRYAARE